MEIKVIDDVIPLTIQNEIEKGVLDIRFPWHFIPSSDIGHLVHKNYLKDKQDLWKNKNIIDPPQFFHNLLSDQIEPTFFFKWFTPILDAIKFDGMSILRMKMNFNYPLIGMADLTHGIPHVDLPQEKNYITAIYYVADADGDTLLFNERNGYEGPLTIQKRITPRKGKIVLFQGDTLHAACPPISNRPRIVVNINIR